MPVTHSGRKRFFTLPKRTKDAVSHFDCLQDSQQHFRGNAAGPQHSRNGGGQVDDGAFQPYLTFSAVQDQRQLAMEIIHHMLGRGGAGFAAGVGAGSGNRNTAHFQQPVCHRMGRNADSDAGQASRYHVRNAALSLHEHGQRPRAKGFH